MKKTNKNPLRFLRYMALLFWGEFIRGSIQKKKRFIGRFLRRGAYSFGLYKITFICFMVYLGARCLFADSTKRKQLWQHRIWFWAIAGLDNRAYLENWIYQRYTTGIKIVVLGMGSIGDVIQITPVLRAMREKFPDAQICLIHRCQDAKSILYDNPYVNWISSTGAYTFSQIKLAVQTAGSADLVVEVVSAKYTINYKRAPVPSRHPDFDKIAPDVFFVTAEKGQQFWAEPSPSFQQPNGKFAWPEIWKPYHFLDVMGMTGNLPITRFSDLDFYTHPNDEHILKILPKGKPIIAIQNGVDIDVLNWAKATGQRATKLLPQETLVNTVKLLQKNGYCLIQIGSINDDFIIGTDMDLRGQTTLRQAAVILRNAACLVGMEGGLVHLARAMKTKSVVMFGPTSVDFFGYPHNTNLTAGTCEACFWAKKDWYIYCPRGLKEAECMTKHRPEDILAALINQSATPHL
jgi:ADP-heptose:LPS heptosyltransferase